ncbi:MAG: hypothetical protein GWN32_00885 [Gemmatimonadetes bacterium]|nr:hypothetical protein [Gemmatimonadota bacterium]
MAERTRLRAVKAVVRPDRRDEYLRRWRAYVEAAEAAGARVRLFEDQVLPGRFLELTEHEAGPGQEGRLADAVRAANLRSVCVRREGDEVLYRHQS